MEGTDQCTLGCTVQANQNSEIGSRQPPTQVIVRRASGASRPPAAIDMRTYFARNSSQRAKRSSEEKERTRLFSQILMPTPIIIPIPTPLASTGVSAEVRAGLSHVHEGESADAWTPSPALLENDREGTEAHVESSVCWLARKKSNQRPSTEDADDERTNDSCAIFGRSVSEKTVLKVLLTSVDREEENYRLLEQQNERASHVDPQLLRKRLLGTQAHVELGDVHPPSFLAELRGFLAKQNGRVCG